MEIGRITQLTQNSDGSIPLPRNWQNVEIHYLKPTHSHNFELELISDSIQAKCECGEIISKSDIEQYLKHYLTPGQLVSIPSK